MIASGLVFLAYAPISQTIELVGSLFDPYPFEESGHSESRFRNGLKQIFTNKKYQNLGKPFYEKLRSSIVHQCRPGTGIILTAEASGSDSSQHLTKLQSGDLLLVVEPLFNDLKEGIEKIWGKANGKLAGKIVKAKLNEDFIVIAERQKQQEAGGQELSYVSTTTHSVTANSNSWPGLPGSDEYLKSIREFRTDGK